MNAKKCFKRILFIFLIFILLIFNTIQHAQETDISNLLEMDFEQFLNVEVITASKTLKKINEVPATVRVISATKIKENGYLTLDEALSDLPGFQFRNTVGFNSYVFQRGLPNQNNLILVLVDGIQINELNSGGFYGGGQYNLENIEQIEVVYGPASALYGTNAITGIINLITKSPEKNRGVEASILYGAYNTINTNLSYGYYNKENNFGIRISGMYKTSEKADLAGVEGDNNWTSNMENFEDDYALDAKVIFKDFQYGLNFQRKEASRSTNYKTVGTNYQDYGTSWNIQFFNTYLKHEFSLTEQLQLSSKIYYRNATVLDNTVAYILDTTQVGYYRPNNLVGVESMFNYNPTKSFHIIAGVLYEQENLASGFSKSYSSSSTIAPPTPSEPENESNQLVSIYLQAQQKILENFEVTAGVRFDHSTVYDDILTPRVGLVYNKNQFTAKALYTEAFRAPKPWDYTSGLGNPNLEPEKIKSYELALGYNLFSKLKLDASLYRSKLEQMFAKVYLANGNRWENVGTATVDGIEFNSEFIEKIWSAYLNYTYNYSIDDSEQSLPEISKHTANLGISYRVLQDLKLNLRANYLGERKNPKIISATNSDIIDQAFIMHTTLSYSGLNNLTLRLIVNNLLDTKYYHTSNRPPERYRQPQRRVSFKVEYKI